MTYQHIFLTIDTHTAGEPTRIVFAGVPFLSGATMAEKRRQLQENHDHVRTALMHEPRGHADMFGAVLTAPSNPQAHAGVVFMDGGGYLAMCGHGTIGAVTAILEMGLVARREPETEVVLDTPVGLVRARALIKDGRVQEVAFQNVPAFVMHLNVPLMIPDLGTVSADIAFGGNIFALVAATQLGLAVCLDCIPELDIIGI